MAALVRLRNSINKSVVNVSKETAASLGAEWKPFKAGASTEKPAPKKDPEPTTEPDPAPTK